ncbi:MAG: hypothetical protein K1X79_10520 [Oligoflexia bacterium]|nr:hypothetical protein [Oligoflexia bacterium]
MSSSQLTQRASSIQSLAHALFRAELSDDQVRALPAQSLYLAIKHLGLPSCSDILEAAGIEQCRLLMDLDLWNKDEFSEDNFWEWLSVADEDHGLKVLQKILKSMDLRLISMMIGRYVSVKTFEEKTDNPPAPGFYTPDQGHTWLMVNIQEGTRHFLLTRLLALVFETNAELFYQLLSVPGVATHTELEEEAFQDRSKRLEALGVPDQAYAFELHAPLDAAHALAAVAEQNERTIIQDIDAVYPLIYDARLSGPLEELWRHIPDRGESEAELTLIINAAIVRFGIQHFEQDAVRLLAQKVKGAISLGLEVLLSKSKFSPKELYQALGLQKLYRVGLAYLMHLGKLAHRVNANAQQLEDKNSALFLSLAGAREAFPVAPEILSSDGVFSAPHQEVTPSFRPFEHLAEVKAVQELLKSL